MEQRQYTRYHVEFPLSFSGEQQGAGTVYNLGLGGCKVAGEAQPAIGAILQVELRPPGLAPLIIHAAAVRWTIEGEVGLDFLGIKESERDRLAQYLSRLT